MALINCKECGKEVSDKAEKCMHCGARTKRKTLGCGSAIAILILLPIIFISYESILNPEKTLTLPKQASVKKFYQGDNWTVFEVGMTDKSKQCELKSSPRYLDNNPENPSTRLKVDYPINNVTFFGENIGVYFEGAKKVTFHIDDDNGIMIIPEAPISGDRVVGKMMKGNTVKIKLDFGIDEPDIHAFSLFGFTKAYKKLKDCVDIASKHAK